MATNDVPGFNQSNNDDLHVGCWAEHEDGSYIFVAGVESVDVIYSIFDTKVGKEYRDAMPEVSFKKTFSWDGTNDKWTWHDKTSFPWDKVMKEFQDGPLYPSARHVIDDGDAILASRKRHQSAAQRVADKLKLQAQDIDKEDLATRAERPRARSLGKRIAAAINELVR